MSDDFEEQCEGCAWSWNGGRLAGAAVAFGLMGMAEAINRHPYLGVRRMPGRPDNAIDLAM